MTLFQRNSYINIAVKIPNVWGRVEKNNIVPDYHSSFHNRQVLGKLRYSFYALKVDNLVNFAVPVLIKHYFSPKKPSLNPTIRLINIYEEFAL